MEASPETGFMFPHSFPVRSAHKIVIHLKIIVFWDVMPCSFSDRNQNFGRPATFIVRVKAEASFALHVNTTDGPFRRL
jgi:hypothetical protein